MLAESLKQEDVLLVSAARTATTDTADISMVAHESLSWLLDVTSASGTGGLRVDLLYQTPSGVWFSQVQFHPLTTSIIRLTGSIGKAFTSAYGNQNAFYPSLPPSKVRLRVTHYDASSYTYSLTVWKK